MRPEERRLTVISSTETEVTLDLATVGEQRDCEVLGLLFAKRNCIVEQSELQWITANSGAQILQFCPFDKTQNHESLYHRISCVNRLYDAFLAILQRCESHYLQASIQSLFTISFQMITIRIRDSNTYLCLAYFPLIKPLTAHK